MKNKSLVMILIMTSLFTGFILGILYSNLDKIWFQANYIIHAPTPITAPTSTPVSPLTPKPELPRWHEG